MKKISIRDTLYNLLLKIRNSEDFAVGVISIASTEENWELIIDYINQHPDVDDQTLYYLAQEMWEGTEIPRDKDGHLIYP